MLKKAYRLSTFALTNPRQIQAKYFSLKYSENKESLSRFAFVVSKKTEARASKRNEMKRKIRAGVEELFENIKPGIDFIFYPKKQTLDSTSTVALGELREVLKKENLLNV
jgi:ribonuclease P protein component